MTQECEGYVTGTVLFSKVVENSLLVRNRKVSVGSIYWNKVIIDTPERDSIVIEGGVKLIVGQEQEVVKGGSK